MKKNALSLLFFVMCATIGLSQGLTTEQIDRLSHPGKKPNFSKATLTRDFSMKTGDSMMDFMPKATGCVDTLSYPYLKQYVADQNEFYLLSLHEDYSVEDAELIQVYSVGNIPMEITGLEFVAGKSAAFATEEVKIVLAIYDVVNGQPSTELSSVIFTIPATEAAGLDLRYVDFPTPVVVSSDYAIGINTVSAMQDIDVMITDPVYNSTFDEQLLFFRSPSYGIPFMEARAINQTAWSEDFDFDLIVHPIVSYSVDADLNLQAQSCVGQSVFIEGMPTPQEAAGNRFVNFYAFADYFSLPGVTNETHIIAPTGSINELIYDVSTDYVYASAGTYNVVYQYTVGFGVDCYEQKMGSIEIIDIPNSDFSYSSSLFCVTSPNEVPTVSAPNGQFSVEESGLEIDLATGEIDFASSTEGSYQIKYSIDNGLCIGSTVKTITISSELKADFSYVQDEYCANETNPQLVLGAGASLGTLSATPTGLVFGSNIGEIDLSASQAGSYTITNDIASSATCPGDVKSFDIEIKAIPTVTLTILPAVCENTSAVEIEGIPAGGNFSGNGVTNAGTGASFDPQIAGVGVSVITYEVTENSCTNSASASIEVDELPEITILPVDALCDYHEPIALLATPADGIFGGLAVSNGVFDPSIANIGVNEVTYTVVNGECVAEETIEIIVDECLSVSNIHTLQASIYPNPVQKEFFIAVDMDVVGELFTVEGKSVMNSFTIEAGVEKAIAVENLSAGIYLLKLSNSQNEMIQRIVIQ